MANEIIVGSVGSFISSGFMGPIILAELREQAIPQQWCREYDISSMNRNTVNIQAFSSLQGAPDDDGVAVDTAYDAQEIIDIVNTPMTTSDFDLGVGEYAIGSELSDDSQEDTIGAIDLMNVLREKFAAAIALAWSKDFVDLFAGLVSLPVGVSGAGLTTNDLDAAIAQSRRKGLVTANLTIALHHRQGEDLEAQLTAANAATAVHHLAADRFMRAQVDQANGLGADRRIMSYKGYDVYVNGLSAQVNGGADEIGCVFVPPSAGQGLATFANVIKRAPRFETDRNARRRTSEIFLSARMAPGIQRNDTGIPVITGA